MGSPIEIKSPLKGVLKNPSYQDFTPDAAIDAMNVRPFDLGGRMRVAQRWGLDKLYPAALNAGQYVQALWQTTIAQDPAAVTPGTLLVNEQFNYANGSLGTASGGVWTELATIGGTSGGTGATVSSFQLQDTFASNARSARYTTAPAAMTGIFILQMNCTFGTLFATHQFGIYYRLDPSNPTGTGWGARVESNGGLGGGTARFLKSGVTFATAAIANGTFTGGSSFILKLSVNGTSASLFVNGVNVLSTTMDGTNAAFSDFGFLYSTGGQATSETFTLDNFQLFSGQAPASLRQTNLLAVSGGNIYESTISTTPGIVSGGTAALSATATPSLTDMLGFAYAVDGFTIQSIDLVNKAASAMVATAGSLPTQCTLACTWRDRLVLAAPRNLPQNFFMSRVGVATDWDYGQLANNDPASAFAGNASTAGHIGQPIVSLMPFSDDTLFIGGDHNLWVVRGDPADGGSIDIVSDAIGVLGANAWAKSPDGTLYFVGSGGLYKILPGSTLPTNITSNAWNEFFRTINRSSQYVVLAWDRDQQGLYLFITNVNPGGTSTHLWYDLRTGGLWPLQYADTQGPVSALVYDGDGATDRQLLLGGRDGFIRRTQLTDLDDDGTAISSFVFIGPIKADDTSETMMEWLDVVLADGSTFPAANFNCQLDIFSASSVEKAFVSPNYFRRKIFTFGGRQSRWLTRIRGEALFFKFSNSTLDKTWGFEKAVGIFTPAGTIRRR